MLQGDDQASASQAQNDQVNDSTQGTPVDQQTPEEVAFNSLSGNAQERFRRIIREKNEYAQRLANLEKMGGQSVPPAPNSSFTSPDERQALETLASKGIATDEKVDRKLDERLNLLRWEMEQTRLEGKYPGKKDGEPAYVREEVEEFIRAHPKYAGYSPEDVFRDYMFRDEFLNLELQRRGSRTGQTQTLRPTSRMVTQEQGLTPEYIAKRTDIKEYPDAVQWQEEHREEIDKVLSQMQA